MKQSPSARIYTASLWLCLTTSRLNDWSPGSPLPMIAARQGARRANGGNVTRLPDTCKPSQPSKPA
ncbi:Protein of unknown function [Pyronema omphalodes CBS 100304]|uniref:Uncharacterized protein n=1 Tax=Pyronema omphalodes (strain CBS 100304) TaxID=1076935 RepID=U4LQB1_PYROM|nr:Protein of unknown function [Pyronema omphalodes CBS 100304]